MSPLWRKKSGGGRGARAEHLARQYLQRQGLTFVAANVRGPGGEIDLIMRHGQTLVFVEVRLRSHPAFSSASESIDARKQHRLVQTAQYYLQQQGLTEALPCRFDVVALSSLEDSNEVQWIVDAFGAA